MSEKTLLPIGKVLNHDGHDLTVLKRLSAGLTGEVYEGTLAIAEKEAPIRVAIKVMKTLEFPMARQFFLKETETMAFLMPLEEEANKEQRLSIKIAPVYYGRGEYEDTPFMVMEFIDGVKIPEILTKEAHLPEIQALTVAWHLYRTLDILHSRFKLTYIDLKFENLWWVSNGVEQLKITDFGTMEDIKPSDTQLRGIRRDLLLGGVYLFAMLTGYTLDYSIGDLRERAEPRIHDHESDFSWGTRRLLRRLLHRNSASRPTSAAAIASELRALVYFWSQSEERLYSMAQNNLAEAERAAEEATSKKQPLSQQGRDYATRARSALDIFRILYPKKDIDSEIKRADSALSIGDYLERGTALLIGRSYTKAHEVFEEGVQWSEDPALLRRWAFLALAGEEVPPSVFEKHYEDSVKIINSLGVGHWDSALERLNNLPAEFTISKGMECLKHEATFFARLEQAEAARGASEFDPAVTLYRQAQESLNKLPEADAKFIRDEEVGDISLLIEEAKALEATQGQAQKLFTGAMQALKQDNWEKVSELARSAYITGRKAPFRLKELNVIAGSALERALKEKESFSQAVQVAHQVSWLGSWESPMDVSLSELWHFSGRLMDAERAIALRDGVELRRAVDVVKAKKGNEAAIRVLLERATENARQADDPVFLNEIADLYKSALADEAAATAKAKQAAGIAKKQSEEKHADADRRLNEIKLILSPISSEPGSLAKILKQAVEAAKIWRGYDLTLLHDRLTRIEEAGKRLNDVRCLTEGDQYRLDEIDRFQETVSKGLVEARQAIDGQEQALVESRRQRVVALSAERLELDGFRQWIKQASDLQINLDAQRSVHLQLRERLIDYFYRCYQILAGEKESDREAVSRQQKMEKYGATWEKIDELGAVKVLTEWATHTMDELGAEAWQEVVQVAEEHQRQIQANLEDASVAYKTGNLSRLAAELDRLEANYSSNLEWQELKQNYAYVNTWNNWLETQADKLDLDQPDAALLKDLRDYIDINLPRLYWEQSAVPAYLKKAGETAHQNFSQAMKHRNDENMVETLRSWLGVEWTQRKADPVIQKPAKWNKSDWLRDVYRAAERQDMKQVTTLVSEAALPENVEMALHSFSISDWQNIKAGEEKREKNTTNLKRALVIVPITLAVLVILGLAGYWVYHANQDTILQALKGTYTPTITSTATETITPTMTPTITETPTITLTPSPIPPSNLLAPDAIYPILPVSADSAWILNVDKRSDPAVDQYIQVDPPLTDQEVWAHDNSADVKAKGESYYYTTTGNVEINWEMDQPFDAGTYAVYFIDTKKNSAGSNEFAILLDDTLATPFRGLSSVTFQDVGQKTDDWLSLGYYEVGAGQKMSIHLNVGSASEDAPFALDRLLIIKISDSQRTMLDGLPAERTLVSLLDDDRATFIELVGGNDPTPVTNRGQSYTDPLTWDGNFLSRSFTDPSPIPIWVDWQPVGQLAAGEYELYVWIPSSHATVVADYTLLVNGEAVQRDTPAEINQEDYSSEWVSLGTWTIPNDASVGVRMLVPIDTSGEVGVDAVAIVRVGQ